MLQNYKYACVVKKNYKVANVILEFINLCNWFLQYFEFCKLIKVYSNMNWSSKKEKNIIYFNLLNVEKEYLNELGHLFIFHFIKYRFYTIWKMSKSFSA